MIATVAAFIEVAVIAELLVRSSVLPATLTTVGAWVSPPMLLKVMLASVLSKVVLLTALPPARVSTPLPLIVTLLVAAIWPALSSIVTAEPVPCVPPLMIRSPGMTTLVALPTCVRLPVPRLARFSVPWSTTVPPV